MVLNKLDILNAFSPFVIIEEESGVSIDRIRRLEIFEKDDGNSDPIDFNILKDQGNIIYSLKDFKAAEDYYKMALRIMLVPFNVSMAYLTIGQEVLVEALQTLDYNAGMISGINEDCVDVVFDDDDDELCDCKVTSLIPLCKPVDRIIQRSVYMNMARCSLKRHRNGWATKYCSIAIAISKSLICDEENHKKQLADSLYFRGKLLISINRLKFAEKVNKTLILLQNTLNT